MARPVTKRSTTGQLYNEFSITYATANKSLKVLLCGLRPHINTSENKIQPVDFFISFHFFFVFLLFSRPVSSANNDYPTTLFCSIHILQNVRRRQKTFRENVLRYTMLNQCCMGTRPSSHITCVIV